MVGASESSIQCWCESTPLACDAAPAVSTSSSPRSTSGGGDGKSDTSSVAVKALLLWFGFFAASSLSTFWMSYSTKALRSSLFDGDGLLGGLLLLLTLLDELWTCLCASLICWRSETLYDSLYRRHVLWIGSSHTRRFYGSIWTHMDPWGHVI
jgi:hypothetical protein